MPDIIVEQGPNWTEIATVILTAALVIAAIAAALQVNRQILQAQRHHDQQLRASLRPLVVAPHAESLVIPTSPPHVEFKIWTQNVGPGPALVIDLRAWLRIPTLGWEHPAQRIDEIEKLKLDIDIDAPELTARFGALAANTQPSSSILVPHLEISPDDYASKRAVLLYTVLYKDTFENSYPSRPREEWKLGHIEIAPLGSWHD